MHLILKEEVDLWEISLARIVDAFCAEVEQMERVDLDSATEFLLIAATLVELKARRLLPGRDDVDLDEELLRFEERDLLLARLLECKTFQDAAKVLNTRIADGELAASRAPPGPRSRSVRLAPDPLERVSLDAFLAAAGAGLAPKVEPEVETDHVAPIRASVRDAIETVLALLPASGAVRFRDLTVGVGREARGDRALPRRARAVQAGCDRPRAGRELRRARRAAARRGRARRARPRRHSTSGATNRVLAADAASRQPRRSMNIGEDREARAAIEAVIMAAVEPVPPAVLAQLVELPTARVEEICDELVAEYEREGRGFTLGRVAGGYRYQTHSDAYPYVERFVLEGQTARLSGPALETLAIIAYKQPISRAQLSAIRGVNVDATLKTLVARGYVEEIGHEPTPGNPSLFGTTDALPRTARSRLARPAAGARRLRPEASVVEALERGLRVRRTTRRPSREPAELAAELRRRRRR